MNKKKKASLASGVLLLSLAGILVRIFGFLYKVPLNAYLGDEMANVNAAYAVYTVLYTLSTAGIPAAVAVVTCEDGAGGPKGGILRPAVGLLSLVGALGTVLLFAAARPVSLWNSGGDTYLCTLAIAPSLFFVSVASVFRGAFQGEGRMAPIAVSELIEAAGKMGLGLWFVRLASGRFALGQHAAAAFSVAGITAGVAAGAVFLAVAGRGFLRGAPRRGVARRLFSLSLPIMAAALVLNLSSLLDAQWMRPLLTRYSGDPAWAKAMYSDYSTGAVTLFNLPSVLIYPIACAVVPAVASRRASGDAAGAAAALAGAVRVSSLVSLPCALVLSALGGPILSFVFRGDADMAANAGPLLSLLAPAVFLSAMLTVTNAGLQAFRLQSRPIRSVLPALMVKTACSLFLVPRIGAVAAPLGTLGFYLVVTVGNFYWLGREAGFRFSFRAHLLRPLGAAALGTAAAFGCYHALSGGMGTLALLPAALAFFLAFLPSSVLLGCVTEEDLLLLPFGGRVAAFLRRRRLLPGSAA